MYIVLNHSKFLEFYQVFYFAIWTYFILIWHASLWYRQEKCGLPWHNLQLLSNFVHSMKKWTKQDLRFCKMSGQKDKKKSRRKLVQNDQMTDFCENLKQILVSLLYLELNVIRDQ